MPLTNFAFAKAANPSHATGASAMLKRIHIHLHIFPTKLCGRF
jgi:hypothetical protein